MGDLEYMQYIKDLTKEPTGTCSISPGAGEETNSSTTGEYTIDKTFDELEALYLKGGPAEADVP